VAEQVLHFLDALQAVMLNMEAAEELVVAALRLEEVLFTVEAEAEGVALAPLE
jgi:hypothetical protein